MESAANGRNSQRSFFVIGITTSSEKKLLRENAYFNRKLPKMALWSEVILTVLSESQPIPSEWKI